MENPMNIGQIDKLIEELAEELVLDLNEPNMEQYEQQLLDLTKENQYLKQQMTTLEANIIQLKSYINTLILDSSDAMSKKSKKNNSNNAYFYSKKQLLCKARNLYYNEVKHSQDLNDELFTILSKGGLLKQNKNIRIPLHLIRLVANQQFDELNPMEQMKWIERVKISTCC